MADDHTNDEGALDAAWQAVFDAAGRMEATHLTELFATDPDRFDRFKMTAGDLVADLSKNWIDDGVVSALLRLFEVTGVVERRDQLFAGAAVNSTEARAAFHMALRSDPNGVMTLSDGTNVMPAVAETQARINRFVGDVHSHRIVGGTGQRFTDVVNIGIGGSDLGPAMAVRALRPYWCGPRVHFVSNLDPSHIGDTLGQLDPRSTLFLIASKTFTTAETMTNAGIARDWISDALGSEHVPSHFVAMTSAVERAVAFGVADDRAFGFWDWVGGRYSVWSAIGLPLMMAIGPLHFTAFLEGARKIDEHFVTAPARQNLPVMLGLLNVLYRNGFGLGSRAIVPYDERLGLLPAYLQQLDMESNGKSVTHRGEAVTRATGPVIWGAAGTNGQHAFFQLLHQGTDVIPVEFMVAAQPSETDMNRQHDMLVANCLAQSEALMSGRSASATRASLENQGYSPEDALRLAPHATFPGNRPSTTIVYPQLTPDVLGQIIAMHEHRVFVEAAVWGINPFDQFGVELGKKLASELLGQVCGDEPVSTTNASTKGLLASLHAMRGRTSES